jgi:hypothetical protein
MAENILKLKKRAVAEGMPKADAMKADRAALEAFLSAPKDNDGKKEKASKKAVAKKKGAAPAKKSGAKSSKKAAPASEKKASTKTTKKTSTKKTTKTATRKTASRATAENTSLGRSPIDKSSIDWTIESDEWNPREGGPVAKLFKALKSSKGNIDKAFEKLSDDMYDFVGKTKRDGTKRTKGEAKAMLRYRLNRTLYEYAKRTGQHESATDRIEYGTGKYATTRKKTTSAKTGGKKATSASKKPGRKASTKKTTAKKR